MAIPKICLARVQPQLTPGVTLGSYESKDITLGQTWLSFSPCHVLLMWYLVS